MNLRLLSIPFLRRYSLLEKFSKTRRCLSFRDRCRLFLETYFPVNAYPALRRESVSTTNQVTYAPRCTYCSNQIL